jgi:DNA-binding transcriptional MerR regulator/NAD-dependent dihydropyrimidine dehydrogenase PreA subunit
MPPALRVSGQRRYGPSAVQLVGMIVFLRDVGFSLAETKTLIGSHSRSAAAWRELTRSKLAELEERIERAQAARIALQHALRCKPQNLLDCPNFDALCQGTGDDGTLRHSGRQRRRALRNRSSALLGGGAGTRSSRRASHQFALPSTAVRAGTSRPWSALNLDAAGVKAGERGEILTNEYQRTANPRIWAAGGTSSAARSSSTSQARVAAPPPTPWATPGGRWITPHYPGSPSPAWRSPRQGSPKPGSWNGCGVRLPGPAAISGGPRGRCPAHPRGGQAGRRGWHRARLRGEHRRHGAGEMVTAASHAIRVGMTVTDLTEAWAPYLTMSVGLRLAAQAFSRDVSKLSCCAASSGLMKGDPHDDLTDLSRFTDGSIAGRQARLPGPLRGLHRAVLRRFLQTGSPPTARWGRPGRPGGGTGRLHPGRTVRRRRRACGERGRGRRLPVLRHPHPAPRRVGRHARRVRDVRDRRSRPARHGRDGRITSADPQDGTPIEVTVHDGTWSWTPAGTVVTAGRATGCGTVCNSFEAMCPNTVFHASPESARAYLASRDSLDAQILDQDTAIECGRLNFGTLLTTPA